MFALLLLCRHIHPAWSRTMLSDRASGGNTLYQKCSCCSRAYQLIAHFGLAVNVVIEVNLCDRDKL